MPAVVRAVLLQHADAALGRAPPAAPLGTPSPDPTELVDAATLSARIAEMKAAQGEDAMVGLAASWVASWARTFPTLVRHLRGRPERALSLWVSEVYPFLRGNFHAVAALPSGALRFQEGIPPELDRALTKCFVELSGARVRILQEGDAVRVEFVVAPRDRLGRALQVAARLRVPTLVATLLAASVGVLLASAAALDGTGDWFAAALIVGGAVMAQAGANAVHELGAPERGPLASWRPGRRWWLGQAALGFTLAGACAFALAVAGRWPVWIFAPLGIAAAATYRPLARLGLGPLVAGIVQGPLVTLGAFACMAPGAPLQVTLLPSFALGACAAATILANDLADQPLDAAGGKRTLAVTLPGRGSRVLLVALLAAPILPMFWLTTGHASSWVLLAAATLVAVAAAARLSGDRHDPRDLAPVRALAIVQHLAIAAALVVVAA